MHQVPLRLQRTGVDVQEEDELEPISEVREARSSAPTSPVLGNARKRPVGKILFGQERGKAGAEEVDLSAHVKAMRTLMVDSCDKLSRLIEDREKRLGDKSSDLVPLPGVPDILPPSVQELTPRTIPPAKQQALLSFPTQPTFETMRTRGMNSTKTPKVDETTKKPLRGRRIRHRPVFGLINADALKEQLKDKLSKGQYDVEKLYSSTGAAQRIARAPYFEWVTAFFIVVNSVWIGIETDLNDAVTLADAAPVFIVVENLFCAYFLGEWAVRVLAFESKVNIFRDSWLMFDAVLLGLMMFETWILCPISAAGGKVDGMGSTGMLGVFRALRLSRMARMARLLKFFPELAVIIKAMQLGIRSICWMMVVLMIVVYTFAIMFTQLLDGKNQPKDTLANESFSSVVDSVSTLLLAGVLPDQADIIKAMGKQNLAYYLLMLAYMMFASVAVINLIVGTLVEVVRVSSHVEHEEIDLLYLRQNLEDIMYALDMDNNGNMNRTEFEDVLSNTEYAQTLKEIGIDVLGLVDMVDVIFEDEDAELSLENFTMHVFRMRDTNTATVKDLSEHSRKMVADVKQALKSLQPSTTLS